MNFRLTKQAENLCRITLGRNQIGWARLIDGAWIATDKTSIGTGRTAIAAFEAFVRARRKRREDNRSDR